MARIEWDKIEDRVYESGLDRGVLYLPDGSAMPWNGLLSVDESFDTEISAIFYDGMKISEDVTVGSFSASMSAFTYPEEFVKLEGFGELKNGVYICDQAPSRFGLSYRTRVGSAIGDDFIGYKIHVIYNVLALPSSKSYKTVSDTFEASEFQWNITAIPEEVLGFRPTSHFVINSVETDPWLLEELETILYGNDTTEASLISLQDLLSFINNWYRVKIIDNGDGTWTAISSRDGFIQMLTPDTFEIDNIKAVYLDADTYIIADTDDASDV